MKEAIDEELIKNDFTRNVTVTGSSGKKSSKKFLDYTSSHLLLQDLHKNIDQGIENIMLILALSTGLRYGGHSNIDITTSTYAHVLKELRERDSEQTSIIYEQLLVL